jgi:hypothetical protein
LTRTEDAREVILGKLREGYTLRIWRRDDPDLRIVNDLAVEGLVETEIVQLDEQSSYMKVWIP